MFTSRRRPCRGSVHDRSQRRRLFEIRATLEGALLTTELHHADEGGSRGHEQKGRKAEGDENETAVEDTGDDRGRAGDDGPGDRYQGDVQTVAKVGSNRAH